MLFDYKIKDKQGRTIEGIIEAPDEKVAADVLEEKGFFLVYLAEHKKTSFLGKSVSFLERVKVKDLVVFSRQLAVMASATLPIVQALRILVKQTSNQLLKKAISDIADEVDGGAKLSQTFSRYPKIFSNFFISMVRSGETSGQLDEVLNYLADQQEKDYNLMSKIRGAMIYPAFILVGLGGVGIVMMVFVVPKLTEILKETGGELPFSTRILIGLSDFLSNFWWILLLGLGAIVLGIKFYIKSPSGRTYWDFLKLKIPIFGRLFQHIYLVRFTRSLSTLISGGVPLTQALKITADVVGNAVYKNLILKTIKEVEDGKPIASTFLTSKEVPLMISHMMSVGESTGRLNEILDKLTDFYSREIDNLVGNLVALIEPLIIMVLGLAVGVMVASIILPMYNLASSF